MAPPSRPQAPSPLRRAWPVLALVVGALGLLAPMLLAPVMSDSRYHYAAAPARFHDSYLGILPWTIHDMGWRLEQGRIAPVGVFYQHVLYLTGMKLSRASGTDVYVSAALIKLGLLASVVLAFRAVLRGLRTSEVEGAPGRRLDPALVSVLTLAFAVLLVLGVTTALPVRNGWTTFVALTIGGCVILLGSTALALAAVQAQASTRRWVRVASVLGVVVVGSLIVLSYEMHYAAAPFVVLLVLLNGRPSWSLWRPVEGDRARWVVAGAFVAGFVPTLVTVRLLIRAYSCQGPGCYPGLGTDFGPWVRTMASELVAGIPGAGIGIAREDAETAGITRGLGVFSTTGTVFGLLLAIGFVVLARRTLRGLTTSETTADTAGLGDLREDTRALRPLVPAAIASLLAVTLLLSLSRQSHEIADRMASPYRNSPWVWTLLCVLLTVALATAVLSRGGPGASVRLPAAWWVLPVAALLVGAVVWPSNVLAVRTQRGVAQYAAYEQVQHHLVIGSPSPAAERERCRLDTVISGYKVTYFENANTLYRRAYKHAWGRPFCARRAAIDARLDTQVD